MDKRLFFTLINFAEKNRGFGKTALVLTKVSSKIFFVIYISLLIWLSYDIADNIEILTSCIAIPFIALCCNLILRKIIKRPRPYESFNINMKLPRKKEFSFPSNHSASACIIAMTCMYYNIFLGLIVFALAVFTGISRILTGMHYPSDVLAGFTLSLIISLLYFL